MSTRAAGTRTSHGALELRRTFSQSPSELWSYLVNSKRLALWFGTYSGDPDSEAVDVVLLAEEGEPSEQVEILECDPQALVLKVRTGEGEGSWQLELQVHTDGAGSELIFQMPGLVPSMAGSVGPGWEYYLDRLTAAVSGGDVGTIDFEKDYYPALSEYYEQLFQAK